MAGNRGKTCLRNKRRNMDPMDAYDSLPSELRQWVASAMLPWSARSVLLAYQTALRKTDDRTSALRHLDSIERKSVAKDILKIWGHDHPFLKDSPQDRRL